MATNYTRSAERVIRTFTSEKKGSNTTRETMTRSYMAYRFHDKVAADALAGANVDAASGTGVTLSDAERLKLAACDPRVYLHETEAASVLASAQARTLGSRPRAAYVANLLRQWDGRGHIVLGDTVVVIADAKVPAPRTVERISRERLQKLPAGLVQAARTADARAIEARKKVRALKSGE